MWLRMELMLLLAQLADWDTLPDKQCSANVLNPFSTSEVVEHREDVIADVYRAADIAADVE